jgi:hypothetical protein
MEILETIRRKGRFLRRGAQGWVDVSTVDVQQKIAHALQYRRRCVLREKETSGTPDSSVPYPPIIHPQQPQTVTSPSNNHFDANAIALAMVSNSGNYALAQLDAQARQEQYKLNHEYYQKYLNHLQQKPNGGSNKARDSQIDNEGDGKKNNDHVGINQQQQHRQHPLYALSHPSHPRRPSGPTPITNTISSVASTSLSQMPNLLLHRYSSSISNSNQSATGSTSSTMQESQQRHSSSDNLDSSGLNSVENNLDSSGLHSLADVISQLCSQEGIDNTLSRGYSRS